MKLSRRTFIATAALTPLGCVSSLSYEQGLPVAQPNPLPLIRAPQVGQEWTYLKRNVFNGASLGLINERVTSIGANITIEQTAANGGKLPNEIQTTWGMVATDTLWSKVLNFSPALPLWPLELSTSWSKQFNTKYSVAGYPGSPLNWQEFMSVQGWEKIAVPAGEFTALKFQKLINYDSEDPNKVDCIRKVTAWFAPQIGRWVARESSGSYRIQAQVGAEILEDRFVWQLTAYK
jgi:hypothetical protein